MKKLVMVVLVAVMAASTCFAQMGGTPEERLKRELDGLTTALNLTPDQVAKVTPIITDSQKARSEMFQKMRDSGGQMDREKMMAEGQKMQADADAKIKAVLTAEQGSKLDAYRKKQAEERAARMQNR
jgi:Spy/CpxP family protein refolding chaperone